MKINGVFEGGGVKGIALVGAIKSAEQKGITFHRVAGTSSGSIIASFLAAGYSADEMKQMILDMPFSGFLQKSWLHHLGLLGSSLRILLKKGLYSGEALEFWLKQKLEAKGVRTFADLPKGKLRIIASDISDGKLLVLPDDIAQYGIQPELLSVARAIRMSCSIPYFFEPVLLRKAAPARKKQASNFVYVVDGGILSNFPLWLFDQENQTNAIPVIGFQLVGERKHSAQAIRGPISMFQALLTTMMDAHDERYIEKHLRFRTIKIPTLGTRTTDFDLSQEQSSKLFDAGYDAGRAFFQNWSVAAYYQGFEKFYPLAASHKV